MIGFAWLAFGAVLLLVALVCVAVVWNYTDKHETEALPFVVAVLALMLPLLVLLLIPVDIYNVSSGAKAEDVDAYASTIEAVYYILYAAIAVVMFVLTPFSYFYYEEDDEDVTIGQKALGACKYTAFTIVFLVVLIVIGVVLFAVADKAGPPKLSEPAVTKWTQNIVKDTNGAAQVMAFVISCLTTVGYTIWITYTAYGLSALPIRMIRGKKHIGEEAQKIRGRLDETREQRRLLNSKYAGGRGNTAGMSRRDRRQAERLAREERVLSRHSSRLDRMNQGWRRALTACKPFGFIFGILFVGLSLLIIASMAATNIYKLENGACGAKCGFILSQIPKINVNGLDLALTSLAAFFPADFVLLGIVVLYIFFATLAGIVGLRVRFLWLELYPVRSRATAPQGLLLAAAYLTLSVLAMNMELITMAPQYATWGTQTWINQTGPSSDKVNCTATPDKCQEELPCSFSAPVADVSGCHMTQIGSLVNFISVRTPFFGVIYYVATWIFLIAWLGGILLAFCIEKGSHIIRRDDDSDESE